MMEISLDMAREVLIDYLVGISAYECKECGTEFFMIEGNKARYCPACKSENVVYSGERDVELLDWGVRRADV